MYWEDFEIECFNYLSSNYGNLAKFTAYGKADSTVADIYVQSYSGKDFYIETKSPAAQCGQFVLIPNELNKEFEYSIRNSTPFFDSTGEIINYMNSDFDRFVNPGTAGTKIDLPEDVFYDWIKDYYLSKRVGFFVTKGNDYIIIPIESFDLYFDVNCMYREKKSGSTNVARNDIKEILELIFDNAISGNVYLNNGIGYVDTSSDIDEMRLRGQTHTFYFKQDGYSRYRIRKLSNTSNANVIFQIKLKRFNQIAYDLRMFENNF